MYCFKKAHLSGSVSVPSSKSIAHRALISASLAQGTSYLYAIDLSNDIEATIQALRQLGAEIEILEDKIKVVGIQHSKNQVVLNAYESASTLRFLIPMALYYTQKSTWLRSPSLAKRPLDPYYSLFDKQGIEYDQNDALVLKGKLKPGHYLLEGHISSQFISGLLFVLPLLNEDSTIELLTPLQSKHYVDLTIDVLNTFGITIIEKENGYYIKGHQVYMPCDYSVEKDYSHAAFFLMAASLGHPIKLKDLNLNSKQGDRSVLDLLKKMGCDYNYEHQELSIIHTATHPIHIDGRDIPDLICALVLGLVHIEEVSSIKNIERLKYKECDRLKALLTYLNQIGVNAWVNDNTLYMKGNKHLKGGTFSSYHDHRMAMLLSMLALECEEDVYIDDIQCVHKSYPDYFKDYTKLGGKYHVIHLEK